MSSDENDGGSKAEAAAFYRKHDIKVIGKVPQPYINYSDITRSKNYAKYFYLMEKLGKYQIFSQPTAVQAQVIPTMLAKRSFMVVAQRSEDRITAYLMPALMQICHLRGRIEPGIGPLVVILAPNEEICLEIKFFADLFGDFMNVKNTCNYEMRGGTSAGSLDNKMYTGVDIAIATPKRFLDAILDEETSVARVNTVIFDEMDRICDMGYGASIVDNVMSKLPKGLLTAVFSSTLPLDVRIFVEEYCQGANFVQLSVAEAHLTRTPIHRVQQHVHVCEKDDKTIMLYHLLQSILSDTRSPNKKTLVFVEEQFYPISEFLLDKGLPVLALIDVASDTQRYILNKFKDPKCNQIMVTRSKIFHGPGMEVPNLKFVVNVDFPRTFVPAASYIYQVSRAGRLANNEKGVAHTFMTLNDARKSQEVVDILRECKQDIDSNLLEMANTYNHPERQPKKRPTMFETTLELCKVPENLTYGTPNKESISADEYLNARRAPERSRNRIEPSNKHQVDRSAYDNRVEDKRVPKPETDQSPSSSRKHCHHSQKEDHKQVPRSEERSSSRSQRPPALAKETRRRRSRSRDYLDHKKPHHSQDSEPTAAQLKNGPLLVTIRNNLYAPLEVKHGAPGYEKDYEVKPSVSRRQVSPKDSPSAHELQGRTTSPRTENRRETDTQKIKPEIQQQRSAVRQERSRSSSRRSERTRDDSRQPLTGGDKYQHPPIREERSRSRSRRENQDARGPSASLMAPPDEEIMNELKPISELSPDQLSTFHNEVQSFLSDSMNLLTKMGIIHIIPPTLLGLLEQYGYEKLTELQREVWWNIAKRNHDTLTVSCVPHSERILAYLLPAIVFIADWKSKPCQDPTVQGPLVLILLPTTEMVDFVHLLAKQFCTPLNCSEIAIATPKSVVEMLRVVHTTLVRCTYLVFDELHRMLSAGMMSDMAEILRVTNANAGQKIRKAFSPENTIYEQLFAENQINAKLIVTPGGKSKGVNAFSGIHQYIEVLEDNQSMRPEMTRILTNILVAQKDQADFKIVIFVSQLPSMTFVEKIQEKLPLWAPKILCPEKGQSPKDALIGFCRWGHQILIATDDMIGQISMKDVKLVINYDFPDLKKLADFCYLHRITQTDPKASIRLALTFLTPWDAVLARPLYNIHEKMKLVQNPLLKVLMHFETAKKVTDKMKKLAHSMFQQRRQAGVGDADAMLAYMDKRKSKAKRPERTQASTVLPVAENPIVESNMPAYPKWVALNPDGTAPIPAATSEPKPTKSSDKSYYNYSPKVVINNQFINTNMAGYKAGEAAVASELVPPPPPKIDFQALNKRKRDYDEEKSKTKRSREAQIPLNNSVSAFLEKLTNRFGGKY